MKNVMTRAWEIARNAVEKFGGKVKEYFAQALKMAWAEVKKGEEKMDIQKIIKRYDLMPEKQNGEYAGRIQIRNGVALKKDNALDLIKDKREEIICYFKEKEEMEIAEQKERKAKIDAIPGLKEIKKVLADMANWRMEFNASFDYDGGLGVRQKPVYNLEEMYQKYPVAAAYLKAESMMLKSNYRLSSIGKIAMERIVNGEDYKTAINDTENNIEEFTKEHIWD